MGFAYLCGLPMQVAIVLRDLNIESMDDFSDQQMEGSQFVKLMQI